MKLRLDSAPWTFEDSEAWWRWLSPHEYLERVRLRALYLESDRRDADLMLELVDLRSIGAYADVRMLQTMAGEDGCACGGWMGHYRWVSPKWSDGRKIT